MKKLIFDRPDQVSEIRHYGFLAVGEAVCAHICSADVFYDPYYLGKNLNQESGVSRKIWEIVPTLITHEGKVVDNNTANNHGLCLGAILWTGTVLNMYSSKIIQISRRLGS